MWRYSRSIYKVMLFGSHLGMYMTSFWVFLVDGNILLSISHSTSPNKVYQEMKIEIYVSVIDYMKIKLTTYTYGKL